MGEGMRRGSDSKPYDPAEVEPKWYPRWTAEDAFAGAPWEWKERPHRRIVGQVQRLGWSLDWNREYFTLDPGMSFAVQEVFIRLYEKGLVYRGHYITNWCPSCRTALSDEEVEHSEQRGKQWTESDTLADWDGID